MDLNRACFYIDFNTIRMVYPYQTNNFVKNFGVLEKYRNKKYTMKEINEIIAELIIRRPYIENSMTLHIVICDSIGYYHILDFNNYYYDKQKQTESAEIKFLF